MKKYFFIALICLFACNKKEEVKLTDADFDTIKTAITDSITKPVVGADQDAHGCKSSAGYTWSALKNECVRVFEAGTMLKPYNDPTGAQMAAFVIFDNDKAELFIQTEKPMILQRKSEGAPFVNGDWQLSPWKGYVLKKKGTILFTGQ